MAKKVVIAEDNAGISAVLGKFVKALGLEVYSATDGLAALDLVRELRPDLVLLDVLMPHRSGFEVCQAIKRDPELAKIPVFILTSLTEGHSDGDGAWKDRSGADGFFSKPVQREQLQQAIQGILKLPGETPLS